MRRTAFLASAFIGVTAPTHTKLTDIVKKVERHELKAVPALLGG